MTFTLQVLSKEETIQEEQEQIAQAIFEAQMEQEAIRKDPVRAK